MLAQTLANWALNEPVSVEIGERRSPAETVTHAFYPVGMDQRDDLIIELIKQTGYESMMIFTRTKRKAQRIYDELTERGFTKRQPDVPEKLRG